MARLNKAKFVKEFGMDFDEAVMCWKIGSLSSNEKKAMKANEDFVYCFEVVYGYKFD